MVTNHYYAMVSCVEQSFFSVCVLAGPMGGYEGGGVIMFDEGPMFAAAENAATDVRNSSFHAVLFFDCVLLIYRKYITKADHLL